MVMGGVVQCDAEPHLGRTGRRGGEVFWGAWCESGGLLSLLGEPDLLL